MATFQSLLGSVSRIPGVKRAAYHALFRCYPPYLGAGVRVRSISEDFRRFDIEMPLRPWNQNYVGTHYGGSLYTMCDPFLMLILIEHLGPDYVVWDKSAEIRFVRPGRTRVRATITLSEEQIAEVREAADRDGKAERSYPIHVVDEDGQVVARIKKRLHVRRRDRGRAP